MFHHLFTTYSTFCSIFIYSIILCVFLNSKTIKNTGNRLLILFIIMSKYFAPIWQHMPSLKIWLTNFQHCASIQSDYAHCSRHATWISSKRGLKLKGNFFAWKMSHLGSELIKLVLFIHNKDRGAERFLWFFFRKISHFNACPIKISLFLEPFYRTKLLRFESY